MLLCIPFYTVWDGLSNIHVSIPVSLLLTSVLTLQLMYYPVTGNESTATREVKCMTAIFQTPLLSEMTQNNHYRL